MKKFAFVLVIALMGSVLFAQDDPKPVKHDASWHQVVLIKYKNGSMDEVKKIIAKYESAADKAGTMKPEQYWFVTGSYDAMLIWDLTGGPADLEWKWSPESIKWWKAFVEQEGSEEAAQKIQKKYSSLVSGHTSQLLRKDK